MPEPSHNRTHRRIVRFTPVISSHPKSSSNRAAPSLIETRNQLREMPKPLQFPVEQKRDDRCQRVA
jgi:hypothetical protein